MFANISIVGRFLLFLLQFKCLQKFKLFVFYFPAFAIFANTDAFFFSLYNLNVRKHQIATRSRTLTF